MQEIVEDYNNITNPQCSKYETVVKQQQESEGHVFLQKLPFHFWTNTMQLQSSNSRLK